MQKFVIFTDSDTDFDLEDCAEFGFHMISMPYVIDEVTYYPYKDGKPVDFEAFYNLLKKGVMPKTSALAPGEYIEYFEPIFKEGKDILYVHFSSAMSGTFNAMHLALEELKEKYPDRKFYEIDTKGITLNSYPTVRYVGELYKAGKDAEEIVALAKERVEHQASYFYASDLKFFARSGRVSGFAAFMGSIIGIHPIINMNQDGVMGSVDKARGKIPTLKKIVQYMIDLEANVKDYEVYIGNTGANDEVEIIKELIIEQFGEGIKFREKYVNPTAGSHCGPGNVGVSFYAKHR